MPGFRQGPGQRPAWMHPQDLVALLTELKDAFPIPAYGEEGYGFFGGENFDDMVDVAWTHDLYEDGKKEDGSPVTWMDLSVALGALVADGVRDLSHKPDEEKIQYLTRLLEILGPTLAIIKCVDRICNLREGVSSFKDARWARYVAETNDYIIPLLDRIPAPYQGWLRTRLVAARDARPVVEAP